MKTNKRIEYGKYIVSDPKICGGEWTFKGTRILVQDVLQMIAKGWAWERIATAYVAPLSHDAIAEAVELARFFVCQAADPQGRLNMFILDENIGLEEKARLLARRLHVRQSGAEVGRMGMQDLEEIIPLLHSLGRLTFFTRDHDFYKPVLRHPQYCLVLLDVDMDEVAIYVRRFLRYPSFRTQARRMGKAIRVRPTSLSW
jgi:uncharacterized protein (DUF433 family)